MMYVLWVLDGSPSFEGEFAMEKEAINKGKEIMKAKRLSSGWITRKGGFERTDLVYDHKTGNIRVKRSGLGRLL